MARGIVVGIPGMTCYHLEGTTSTHRGAGRLTGQHCSAHPLPVKLSHQLLREDELNTRKIMCSHALCFVLQFITIARLPADPTDNG
jgi:hypothetical protein